MKLSGKKSSRSSEAPSSRPSHQQGLTLVELILVVVVIVVMAILFTSDFDSGPPPYRAMCQSNLKQIGIAFRTWQGDYGNLYPVLYFTNRDGTTDLSYATNMYRYFVVMSNELNNTKVVVCPADNRKPARNFGILSNTNISYFLGLDADETRPAMWLAGDRNLVTNGRPVVPGLVNIPANATVGWSTKIHKLRGNVLLSDGSVVTITGARLSATAAATNVLRLTLP